MSSFIWSIMYQRFFAVYFAKKNLLLNYILLWNQLYHNTTKRCFLLFSLVLKNLINYGRRHLKLFTNCHVSWDTLYVKETLKFFKYLKLSSSDFIVSRSQLLGLGFMFQVSGFMIMENRFSDVNTQYKLELGSFIAKETERFIIIYQHRELI